MNRQLLPIDIKKLKEEDRRFLLEKSLNETISNHQGAMHNTAITLSLLAIMISTFSVVYTTKHILSIIVFSVFALIGLIFYVRKYKKSQKNLAMERNQIRISYDELFKQHFDYLNKEKQRK